MVVGNKQLRKSLENGKAEHVFLAKDADPAMTAPIAESCRSRGIPVQWCDSMQDLGRACGIDVGASAAAVLKKI